MYPCKKKKEENKETEQCPCICLEKSLIRTDLLLIRPADAAETARTSVPV